jgi:protein SCO1/2
MIRLRVAVVMVGLAVLAGCASAGSKAQPAPSELKAGSGSTYQGVGLTPPQPRPQFTLKDTSGKTFRFGTDTAGMPTLLFFGYTNCPDVCPTTLADVANALKAVPSKVRSVTQVVFVTTDVKHDTGPVLAAYLRKFDSEVPRRFVGLYGTQAQIDAAQVASHITLAEDGGQTHSAQVLLYGSDDYARVSFLQSNNEADQIAHDLPLVAGIK